MNLTTWLKGEPDPLAVIFGAKPPPEEPIEPDHVPLLRRIARFVRGRR